ncbi:hypothetical protein [Streptomyces virginiae]|uniref:YxiG-like protein n=1 Tax=Streptomyces virginiae TaxID=1961 RepID=UPI003651F149
MPDHVWNGFQSPPTYLRYLFRYCAEARCESFLSTDTWRDSLDDRLLDRETADPDLGGYVWGAQYREMYGAELCPESEATRRWSKAVGIEAPRDRQPNPLRPPGGRTYQQIPGQPNRGIAG